MSIEKIHLRKLLQIFYAPNALRIKLLRNDIRGVIKKDTRGKRESFERYGKLCRRSRLNGCVGSDAATLLPLFPV